MSYPPPVLDSRASITVFTNNCKVIIIKGEALFFVKTGWGALGPQNNSGGSSPSPFASASHPSGEAEAGAVPEG